MGIEHGVHRPRKIQEETDQGHSGLGTKWMKKMKKESAEFKQLYWTLGRYDIGAIVRAKDEKTAMKALLRIGEILAIETLVTVPRANGNKVAGLD